MSEQTEQPTAQEQADGEARKRTAADDQKPARGDEQQSKGDEDQKTKDGEDQKTKDGEDQKTKGGEDHQGKGADEQRSKDDEQESKGEGLKSLGGIERKVSLHHQRPTTQKAERGAEHEDAVAKVTAVGLHMIEDIIYALTALVLLGGAFFVLGHSVYALITHLDEGVTKSIEATMDSLLIVFILVELLSAVRTAIDEHFLVAEPFLLVGILACIKEIVVLSTFRIKTEDPGDLTLKVGVLGAIVIGLALASWVLRRREREPKEAGDGE